MAGRIPFNLSLELGADAQDVESIRADRQLRDFRTAALWFFAKTLIENRGHVWSQNLEAMAAADSTTNRFFP
jgi:hypothetical protein